mmetsp:Transcript_7957/g.18288  ORF Transcript_7957/g.18288 Transcript_7957/m.18288 type:complete len:299 (-) Transcript_7957:95-991(-)
MKSSCLLFAFAIMQHLPAVEAQPNYTLFEFDYTGQPVPPLGLNREGTSVATNYNRALTEGMMFLHQDRIHQYENAKEPTSFGLMWWISSFSQLDGVNGWTGKALMHIAEEDVAAVVAAGATVNQGLGKPWAETASCVFIPQLNIFKCTIVGTNDNYVASFWDDGTSELFGDPYEAHDEGDLSPNGHTSAYSSISKMQVLSKDQMAMKDSNGEPIEATVEEFNRLYDKAWAASEGIAAEGDESESTDEDGGAEVITGESNFSEEEKTILEEDLEVGTSNGTRLLTRISHGLGFLLKNFL